MRSSCLVLLAAAASAVAMEITDEFDCGEESCADVSLLQHNIALVSDLQHESKHHESEQREQREQHEQREQREQRDRTKRMRETAAEYLVQRRLILLAGLVEEGLDQANALALIRSFAGEDWANVDLSSDESLSVLYTEQADALHDMLCHVRGAQGDCEHEWSELFGDALTSMSSLTATLLQKAAGWKVKKMDKAMPTHQGTTDPVLLKLADAQLIAMMKLMVKSGRSEEVVKQMVILGMDKVAQMDNSALLSYVGQSKAELATAWVASVINSICVDDSEDCDELLTKKATDVLGIDTDTTGGLLLQMGVRPAVQVVTKLMKLSGVLELPEKKNV